jgi:N-acyl-D-amino-acid deacylase
VLDLLIKNGMIIDGTGCAGYYGAVGVDGEVVRVLRGDVSEVEARRVIDATGQVVCPGFIDFHAHSGLVMLAEPRHEPKVRQGITTEVIGVDGNSYAPFKNSHDFDRFKELNSGLDGNPPLPGRWSTVAEYLAMFDRTVAVNVCYVVGNSPLRIATVGWEDRPATPADTANMQSLLREAMEEGAWGLSTGLDYPPGRFADTTELIALSREAARLGGIYHSHVRYWMGDRFIDPFKEAIEIGRGSGIATHITHLFQRIPILGGASRLIGLVEDARDEGLDVTFDMFPTAYGSTRLLIMVPAWAQNGGPERLKEVLRSPLARDRLREEMVPRGPSWREIWLTYFKQPQNKQYEGRSVAEIAEMRGQPVADALCDLLLEEDLQISYAAAGINASTLPRFIAHPYSMVGSDALLIGDYPAPQTYGTFPIILGEYVRDEGYLSLPEAIRKMTAFAAQRLGLPDRGLVRDGFKADIVRSDSPLGSTTSS